MIEMIGMFRKAWKNFVDAMSKPMNKVAATILAVYTFLWGLWIASPFWTVFDGATVFSWFDSVGSEYFWGGFAIFSGSVMLYGIARSSRNSLTIGAFAGFIHWLLIALGCFTGDWHNTNGITSLAMAVYCATIYLNLRFVHFIETHQE